MWRTGGMILIATLCLGHPAQDTQHSENEIELSDCEEDFTSCLKNKFFSYVDKLIEQKENFTLTKGLIVVKTSDVREIGAARALDPGSRLKNFVDTHSLRLEVEGADFVDAVSRAGRTLKDSVWSSAEDNEVSEKERGKNNEPAKILGLLAVMFVLKMMMFIPLGIVTIAFVAGKALLIGIIALVISIIVGFMNWVPQQKLVIHEIVNPPVYPPKHSIAHDSGGASGYGSHFGNDRPSYEYRPSHGSGWGRSLEAQNLAYSAQKPQ